jgi:endonuclease/exonuclease/phosphatase family metal-dependent hydrolase
MTGEMVRFTAWNCRSGSVHRRLSEVAELNSDIVFLQECRPEGALPLGGDLILQTVGGAKGLALAAPSGRFTFERVSRVDAPVSSIAAIARGPLECLVLGQWTHPPNYQAEILQLVDAFGDLIRRMPTVLMGDLNTGPQVGNPSIRGGDVFGRLRERGLASAYHLHHGVDHGYEGHATYHHASGGNTPWHIDYCFVPEQWRDRIADVEIAGGQQWADRSDHRPITVTLTCDQPRESKAQP